VVWQYQQALQDVGNYFTYSTYHGGKERHRQPEPGKLVDARNRACVVIQQLPAELRDALTKEDEHLFRPLPILSSSMATILNGSHNAFVRTSARNRVVSEHGGFRLHVGGMQPSTATRMDHEGMITLPSGRRSSDSWPSPYSTGRKPK
jgi:hypothetical protein